MVAAAYLVAGTSAVALFVALSWLVHRARLPLVWYCLPFSVLVAITYAVNMWYVVGARGGTLYNGFDSDNAFQVAYVNNALHGNYLGDYYDKLAPTHYPPLWFWLVGTVGRLIGVDAITISIIAPLLLLAALPFLVFWLGRYLGGHDRVGLYSLATFFGLGNALVSYVFVQPRLFPPVHWTIYKPYEILAGLLAVAWAIHLARHLDSGGRARDYLLAGLFGGVLILTYYPWFIVAGGAVGLFLLGRLVANRALLMPIITRGAVVLALSLTVSAPYWLPYAAAVLTTAADPNHAWQYVTRSYFDVSSITIGLGYGGTLFFLGAYGLYATSRARRPALVVGLMVVLLLAWFLSAFITYPILGMTFLSWKGRILIFLILAFGSALGLAMVRARWRPARRLLANPLLLCIALLPLLPTIYHWNPLTDQALKEALTPVPPAAGAIVARLGGPEAERTVLASNRVAPYLPALSRMRLFVSHNIHYSNPLARFTDRKASIMRLQEAATDDLAASLAALGVEAIILDKRPDGTLRIALPESARAGGNLLESDWPYAFEEVRFSRQQLSSSCFAPAYEDEDFVAILVTAAASRKTARTPSAAACQ